MMIEMSGRVKVRSGGTRDLRRSGGEIIRGCSGENGLDGRPKDELSMLDGRSKRRTLMWLAMGRSRVGRGNCR